MDLNISTNILIYSIINLSRIHVRGSIITRLGFKLLIVSFPIQGICRQFLSMQDTVCKKHLEDAPILNDHCSVNLTSKPPGIDSSIASSNKYFNFSAHVYRLISDNSTEHGISKVGWKNNKYYRAIQTIQSLLIVLVLCFAAFLIYSSTSGNGKYQYLV